MWRDKKKRRLVLHYEAADQTKWLDRIKFCRGLHFGLILGLRGNSYSLTTAVSFERQPPLAVLAIKTGGGMLPGPYGLTQYSRGIPILYMQPFRQPEKSRTKQLEVVIVQSLIFTILESHKSQLKTSCARSRAICPRPCARCGPAPAHTRLMPAAPSAPCFQ